MSFNTAIQWTDDKSNPTVGCDGCELRNLSTNVRICYAGKLTDRFGGSNKGYAKSFEVVEKAPGRMAAASKSSDLTGKDRVEKPWLNGLRRHIFVSDMSDALSAAIDFDYLRTEIIDVVSSPLGGRHEWQWLTKRPARMAQFSSWLRAQGSDWPANLWAGTSVTHRKTTGRINALLKVGNERTIRFVSLEPQWESIDLRPWLPELDWVIQGGQSGNKKFFDTAWARQVRDHCAAADVAYFLKQLGSHVVHGGWPIKFEDGHGGDWNEWPNDLCVRQMPDTLCRRIVQQPKPIG